MLKPFITASILLASSVASADTSYFDQQITTYNNEVSSIEKQVGYIGKLIDLPLPKKIKDGFYIYEGTGQDESPFNHGLTNNISFIELGDSVMLYNAGPTHRLAKTIHNQIKEITGKQVKWVFLENSDAHASQAASYWIDMGANVYTHYPELVAYNDSFTKQQVEFTREVGPEAMVSRNVTKDIRWYKEHYTKNMGGHAVYFLHYGPSKNTGGAVVYIPSKDLIFAGDMVFKDILPKFKSDTDTLGWVNSLQRLFDEHDYPTLIVPGHGPVTTLEEAKRATYEYLREYQYQAATAIDYGKDFADFLHEKDDSRHNRLAESFSENHAFNLNVIYSDVN